MLLEAKDMDQALESAKGCLSWKVRNGRAPPLRFNVGILPEEGLYEGRTWIS